MKATKRIDVEVLRKKFIQTIHTVQYTTGLQIVMAVKDIKVPSGTAAKAFFEKPSGKFVYQDAEVNGDEITIDVENQALTEYGNVYYQVRLIDGLDTITTFAGKIEVEKSLADNSATSSETVVPAFDAAVQRAVTEIESARDSAITYIGNGLDNTLEIEGKAADAGATGKAISELKGDLDGVKHIKTFVDNNDFIGNPSNLVNVLQVPYELKDFVIHSIISSGGNISTNDNSYKLYMVSPIIPIKGGKTYAIKPCGVGFGISGSFANMVNDGYGLFASDGTSVISKTSLSDLGNDIFLIRTTDGVSYIRFTLYVEQDSDTYREKVVNNFNTWFMVADADESITVDDFIEHPAENSTISKIKRADGSELEIVDDYSRQKVNSIGDVSKLTVRKTGVDGTPNILNGNYETTDFIENVIISSGGNISGSTYTGYCVSPPVAIDGGKTYAIKTSKGIGIEKVGQLATVNDGYGLYGDDGTSVVTKTSLEYLGNNIVLIKTTVGASYVRFCLYKGSYFSDAVIEFNKWWMIETDKDNVTIDDFIKPTAQNRLGGIVMDVDTVPMDSLTESNAILPLYGKTIVNFGDSIFGNIRPPYDISTLIAKYTGANVINCAFGGCRMGQHIGHWDAFSMYRLADAIASNDWSVQDDAIQYDDRTSYAEEPLGNLKAIDWSAVYAITIAYCTNDWGGNNAIDNAENKYDTATLGGAFRYSLEKLLTAYPHIRIVTLGAIYRTKLDSSSEFVEDSDTWLNDKGLLLSQYNDKLKEICEQYHIEYLNNMNIGFNKSTRLEYYPSYDGTHPNVKGLDVYARHIARHM